MFILAESPIKSAGQPSSIASSLRAAKLLSMSSSFSRSTIEVFQLSFCGLAAASFSSCATTSTTAIGCGGGGAFGAGAGAGVATGGGVDALGAGAGSAAAFLRPNFSRILPKKNSERNMRFRKEKILIRKDFSLKRIALHFQKILPLPKTGLFWFIIGTKLPVMPKGN